MKPKILQVDASDADSPEETLFKCALAVSNRYDMCIVCLIESLHAGTQQMLRENFVYHGMHPDDIGKGRPTVQ